ncbi:MAG TPA: hypothetical protein V6C52_00355 [Coleofasciculaceae cyanobacterium]|jgi:hypothetical protein
MVKAVLCLSASCLMVVSPALAQDYTPKECPVVADSKSQIFHVKGDRFYEQLLKQNQSKKDNRVCFKTQKEAREAGYRRSEK